MELNLLSHLEYSVFSLVSFSFHLCHVQQLIILLRLFFVTLTEEREVDAPEVACEREDEVCDEQAREMVRQDWVTYAKYVCNKGEHVREILL